MRFHIDQKIARKIASLDVKDREIFLEGIKVAIAAENDLQFVLDWAALLELLGYSGLVGSLQQTEAKKKIFSSVVQALKMDSDNEVIFYLFDQIFVECLTEVKTLKPILHPDILIDQVRSLLTYPLFPNQDPFSGTLRYYDKRLTENLQDTLHDLILYLAWDRVSVYIAMIFDDVSLKIKDGLRLLKDCLIESFQHIKGDGKTHPGFFRLIEALYAFEMKDENLQNYTDADWKTLCESVQALQPRDSLADVCFIDTALVSDLIQDKPLLKVLTLKSPNEVKTIISLANFMLKLLRTELSDQWRYGLCPYEILCLKQEGDILTVDAAINTPEAN